MNLKCMYLSIYVRFAYIRYWYVKKLHLYVYDMKKFYNYPRLVDFFCICCVCRLYSNKNIRYDYRAVYTHYIHIYPRRTLVVFPVSKNLIALLYIAR